MINNLKNIVFDLGVVLLDVKFNLTETAFIDLGIVNYKQHAGVLNQKSIFNLFEEGKITAENFRNLVRNEFQIQISDSIFDSAWNAMLIDFPQERKDLIKKLRQNHKIFLLSNTNIIHYNHFTSQKYWENNLFDKEYYSHIAGCRKPGIEIFEKLIAEQKLNPAETFYIDDLEENVKAGEKAGFKTHWLKPGQDIISLFRCMANS